MPQKPYPPLPGNPILLPSPSDIILAVDSSDEESPAAQQAKNQRILGHAQSYLNGQPLYIHSARLRGPVINNPWGKGAKQTKRKPVAQMEEKHKSKKRKALCEEDEREVLGTPTQQPEWAVWGTEGRRGNRKAILESSPDAEELLRSACSSLGESVASQPITNRDGVQRKEVQMAVVFSNDVTPVVTPANRMEKHKRRLPTPPALSPGSFYKKSGTRPTPRAASNPALKSASGDKAEPTKHPSRSVSHSPVCGNQGRASIQSRASPAAVSRSKSRPGEVDEDVIAPEADKVMPPLAPADAKKKRIRINFTTMSPFAKQPTGTRMEAKKTPKKRRKRVDNSGMNNDPEDRLSGSVTRGQATKELSIVGIGGRAVGERVGPGINKHVVENRQSDTNGNDARLEARDKNAEIVTSEASPIGKSDSHASEPLSSGSESVSLQPAQRTTIFVSPSPIMAASGERFTGGIHSKVTHVSKPLAGKVASLDHASSADHIGGQQADPKSIEKPPERDIAAMSSAVASELPQSHGQSYFSAPEVRRNGEGVADEDPEPYQSTQTQLMAAKRGFFDALNDSPFFPQSKLSTTTEGTPSVLQPDSFFNLDASKTPTLSFGGSWGNRGKITDTDPTSFKTPVPRNRRKTSSDIRVPGANPPPPPPLMGAEFAETVGILKPSTPEGTTFTPFAAFATPNGTPEPTQKDISPLTFSPIRDATQHPPREGSSTKAYVKFVGFGLLDEDEDATSLNLGPNSFPGPGQKAPDDKEDLVKEVMGFMGQQVWDIDEELKKMAKGNQSTKNADTGKKRRGLGR
ncbi:unnamed protein product [Tuber aestivum]|uniref:Uncharacterized protein n=1 Tax=Tuber aestivum TaxID=59557 RepID=A0A292Q467_9PEZI|nr:unnamed protein product [Tuber aestivum]